MFNIIAQVNKQKIIVYYEVKFRGSGYILGDELVGKPDVQEVYREKQIFF